MADELTLNCWLFGDYPGSVFTVTIPSSQTVYDLKEAIKVERSLSCQYVAACDLDLWKVSIDFHNLKESLKKMDEIVLDEKARLWPLHKLSSIFSPSPSSTQLNVIVMLPDTLPMTEGPTPTRLLSLNCFVLGDERDPYRVFNVKIPNTDNVNLLRDLIKKWRPVQMAHIATYEMQLSVVSFPIDDLAFEEPVSDKPPLKPLEILSDIFFRKLKMNHIHVVVRVPGIPLPPGYVTDVMDVTTLRNQFCDNHKAMPPALDAHPKIFLSNQKSEKAAIYVNRPANIRRTLPLSLLHPVFGNFIDDYSNNVPSSEDQKLALDLVVAMKPIYDSENERLHAIHRVFPFSSTRMNNFFSQGDRIYDCRFPYVIAGFKNELGTKGADPYMLASLNYLDATRKQASRLSSSSFPCLLMLVFGPYISFAGAVWTDRPNIQMLTPAIPCHYHEADIMMRDMLVRQIGACRRAMVSLEKYYKELSAQPSPYPTPNPTLPYPTCYVPPASPPITFKYTSYIPDRLVYFGEHLSSDHDGLCIKFVRTYSKEVHQFCAKEGCAPRLRAMERLPGAWYMIVMDNLREDYVNLASFLERHPLVISSPEYRSLLDNIGECLLKLHRAGLVHGDIRDSNILVKRTGLDGTFCLLDFDMSGEIGKVRYPSLINTKGVKWPAGVQDGELVLAEHDMEMLSYLYCECAETIS